MSGKVIFESALNRGGSGLGADRDAIYRFRARADKIELDIARF